VSDRLGDLAEAAAEAAEGDGDPRWRRELELLRRLRRKALALPEELVRALATARSRSLSAWGEAREADSLRQFAPEFERLLALVRERAQALARGPEPYDSLLDDYEPGMTRSRLEPVLGELRDRLVPLVRDLAATDCQAPRLSGRRFPEPGQ